MYLLFVSSVLLANKLVHSLDISKIYHNKSKCFFLSSLESCSLGVALSLVLHTGQWDFSISTANVKSYRWASSASRSDSVCPQHRKHLSLWRWLVCRVPNLLLIKRGFLFLPLQEAQSHLTQSSMITSCPNMRSQRASFPSILSARNFTHCLSEQLSHYPLWQQFRLHQKLTSR